MSGTVLERLAEWIVSLDPAHIPERVLEAARYQAMNVIASLYAGRGTDGGEATLAAVRSWSGPGPCTALPTRERMRTDDAILAGSAFAMALDYDDYLYLGHTGHSAVLGSWALCEELGHGTRELRTAQVIANEVGGRLGASAVFGPQNGQAWSFIHALEGAAIGARLLGLDRRRAAHALAVALYQPPYTLWPGFMGPTSKVLTAGAPTIAGIRAARLARDGLEGALDIVERPRNGFWAAFTFAPIPHMLTGLGRAWVTDTLAYKRYPGCAYIGTTMDALFVAMKELGVQTLTAKDVKRLDVDAGIMTVEMDHLATAYADSGGVVRPIHLNFSIPLSAAVGMLAGRLRAAELHPAWLGPHSREVRALAERVRLRHHWKMTFATLEAFDGVLGRNSALARLGPRELLRVAAGYRRQLGGGHGTGLGLSRLLTQHVPDLAHLARRAVRARLTAARAGTEPTLADVDFTRLAITFPARVTLVLSDGRTATVQRDVPLGAPGAPGRFQTVEEKLRVEAARSRDEDQIERLIAGLRAKEDMPLEELTGLVVAEATPPPG